MRPLNIALREVNTAGALLRLVDGNLELDNAANVPAEAIALLRNNKRALIRQLKPIYHPIAPKDAIATTRAALDRFGVNVRLITDAETAAGRAIAELLEHADRTPVPIGLDLDTFVLPRYRAAPPAVKLTKAGELAKVQPKPEADKAGPDPHRADISCIHPTFRTPVATY